MFVLGTAGHIDHGKSVLVRALTGIDPDRLREEKERGMTIDLGFAWLKLPSGREVGIVDVPGHERFIKNMLAGIGGIDLSMLIVAANEGVMPQTREHLAILDLLQVRHGVVVITKKDLVDAELLALVKMEVEELIAGTTLVGAPVVAVSAVTGEGLSELVDVIDHQLGAAEPKPDRGRPRLPVDRVFTIAGSGTIVTGTLVDGSLAVGQEVEIVPTGLKSRIRGLQTHKSRLDRAGPGSRVAANLVGVTTSHLQRGDVVASPGWLKPTKIVTVKLNMIATTPRPLRHGANVNFHTGSAETLAKIRLLEANELPIGGSAWAQLALDNLVAVVKGDRFIIRSPNETIGGGSIVETHAGRLRRFRSSVIDNLKARDEGTAEEGILALLETKQPLEMATLVAQGSVPTEEARTIVETLVGQGQLVTVGEGEHRLLFTPGGWQGLVDKTSAELADYHRKFPARIGMPRVELSSRLKLGNQAPAVLAKLVQGGNIAEEGSVIRLPSHAVRLTPEQQKKINTFLASLVQNPYAPPGELIPEPDLLSLLVEQGKVVKVSDNVVFSVSAYDEMVARVKANLKAEGKLNLAGVRDMFQTSRKYAQALLEHLDALKVTRRVGDDRVLY